MPIQNTGVALPIHHGNSYVLIYCFIFQKEGPSYTKILIEGFPDRSVGKEYACNAEDPSSIPGSSGEVDRLPTLVFLGFPYSSAGKESAYNVEDLGSIPGLGCLHIKTAVGKDCSLCYKIPLFHCCSVTKTCSTLQPPGLQPTRLPCSWLLSGACLDSYPLSRWCYVTI